MSAETVSISSGQRFILLVTVLIVAACGLAYEIIAGAVSTYLLGDGVMQFSLTIGVFLFSMGIGSYASRFVRKRLLRTFITIEISVAILGVAMAPALLWVYANGGPYGLTLLAILGGVGVLSGMEIPILLRLFRHSESLRESASSVLGLDYVGALIGALAVPILFIPWVGTIGVGCLFGLLNLAVALVALLSFPKVFKRRALAIGFITLLALPMLAGAIFSAELGRSIERNLYQDPVVYAQDTRFQRVVLTRWRGDLRLFLNGSLQFSSKDEYRYHEALVHPAMSAAASRSKILVLGGGDGLGVREILRWPDVGAVTLVDLDAGVTGLAQAHPDLLAINQGSLRDPRVTVLNTDALKHLEGTTERWDVIIMDLPDPSTPQLSRLYARSTFRLILSRLRPDGVLVTQATSPFFSRDAFWCIQDTIADLGSHVTLPYRVVVPSFGLWGFVLASRRPIEPVGLRVPEGTRHVTTESVGSFFAIPPDESRPAGPECVNSLNDPLLARIYAAGWARYGE